MFAIPAAERGCGSDAVGNPAPGLCPIGFVLLLEFCVLELLLLCPNDGETVLLGGKEKELIAEFWGHPLGLLLKLLSLSGGGKGSYRKNPLCFILFFSPES